MLIVASVLVIALAYGVQSAKLPVLTPTPTVPTSTPTPPPPHTMPPYAPISIKYDLKSSYGFDQVIREGHFVLSRGKSATLTMILTSTADQTLHLTPNITRLPTGVTVQLDSEFITLETNKPVTLKLTITVSSTAPASTLKPEPTIPPSTPEPTPPPIPTPSPEIPYDLVVVEFTLQEEGYRFKTIYGDFQLTIV